MRKLLFTIALGATIVSTEAFAQDQGGRGGCETCNYVKETPGWQTVRIDNDDGTHEVDTITPTGHRYHSRAPDPPRRPAA